MRFQAQATTGSDAARPHSYNSKGRLFAIARSVARKGRYADATKILRRALEAGDCSEAEALDLQARIYAQQGLSLQAEACWRQAKSHDASNGQYDDALARLRRARVATGRGLHILAGVIVVSLLGLMVWQVFFANPGLVQQLNQQKTAVASLQNSVNTNAGTAATRDAELAASIGAFRENVDSRDTQLAEAVALLVTGEDAVAHRDAVLDRLAAATAAIQKANHTSLENLTSERAKADESTQKRIADLRTALAALAKALGSTEESLRKHTEATQGAMEKRLAALQTEVAELSEALGSSQAALLKRAETTDAAITDISGGMKGLPSADAIAALDKRVTQLQEQLAGIAEALQEVRRQMRTTDDSSADTNAATAPASQPTGALP